MTSPIGASPPAVTPNPAGATGATPSAKTAGATLGPDSFLQLLVAQLKYQDPMSPADPTQFLAETAQFTQVQSLNTLTQQSATSMTAAQQSAATNILGKWVDASNPKGADITGIVTGVRITADGPLLEVGTRTTALNTLKEVLATTPPASVTPGTMPA